jgi:hypothetical protein
MAQSKTIADISSSSLLIDIFASKHQIPLSTIKRMNNYQRQRVRQVASGDIPEIGRGERIKALRILSTLGSPSDCSRLGIIIKNKKEDKDIRSSGRLPRQLCPQNSRARTD